jgi:hypothetical protein
MDPYLEGSLWTTFHHSLAAEMVRELAPRLRPRYLVLPEERLVVDLTDAISITTADTYPDVGVIESEIREPEAPYDAAAAVPLRLATVVPEPVPHVSVQIRDVAERRLVTAIEILSPTNKRGEGRAEYVARRQRLLRSTAHLLEIDLLRKGRRVPMRDPLPDEPYFVLLSRAESRPLTEVWPIPFDACLPTVPVPLLPGDPDADLDLQRIFTQVYDLLGYDLAFDYRPPPEVPLSPSQAAWMAANLAS